MSIIARDAHGRQLFTGDKVRLIGKIPERPVVGYVTEMYDMLEKSNKDPNLIYNVRYVDWNNQQNKPIIGIAGWNWDTRNILKVFTSEEEAEIPPLPEPATFDINTLDI